jgi:serine/threonine protein kinase
MISTDREDEYRKAKICDFGLSHLINPASGKAKAEARCGTQGYIAPEM